MSWSKRRRRRSRYGRRINWRRNLVEPLEQRLLLTVVAWDGDGDGVSWEDPQNWDADALPGPDDDVLIDVPSQLTVQLKQRRTSDPQPAVSGVADHLAGTLQIDAGLYLARNQTLSVTGSQARFTALGPHFL